jgi:hypothetical protein
MSKSEFRFQFRFRCRNSDQNLAFKTKISTFPEIFSSNMDLKVKGLFTVQCTVVTRVSCETSFYSKQPKLEPKLVSILSETRCLFRLFRFYIETAFFGVSIEPKQTKNNPKKYDYY